MQSRQGPFLNSQPTSLFQPNLDPVPTHRVVLTTTYTCFPHRNQGPTAPLPPRADAPCSPGTTAPVVLDPRAAADRVPPRSPGAFTPDALEISARLPIRSIWTALPPPQSPPPQKQTQQTPLSDTVDGRTMNTAVNIFVQFGLRRVGDDCDHHGSPHSGYDRKVAMRCAAEPPSRKPTV